MVACAALTVAQAQQMKPEETEVWEPIPPVVTPGMQCDAAPSDAIVLFNGKDLSAWQKPQAARESSTGEGIAKMVGASESNYKGDPAGWLVENGEMVVKPGFGTIETKKQFGSIQLHIEWMAPPAEGKTGQGYSNSGIFLMGLYEVQVLNSYENKTYSNGMAGSVYKQLIPMVNASRKPGEWQAYDIIFYAPKFNADGSVASPARITLFYNGILVQHDQELKGPTQYIGLPKYVAHPEKLSLRLQDHGDPIHFRNIWIREL